MRSRVLIALLCLYFAATSLPAQAPTFRIAGLVINARDNSPVRHCHMTATLVVAPHAAAREPLHAESDDKGRFALDLPSAGNWQLSANAHNIRTQQLDEHEGFFSGVILTDAQPSFNVVFHAVPDAIMTGTVTDEAGEPVQNAQVALFSINPSASQTGSESLQQHQGTQTDDRGRYEFSSLAPGSYLVQVQARPWYATLNGRAGPAASAPASPDPSLDVVYPTQWYPGVSDSASAGVIAAHPGDTLEADFRLQPVASAHLLMHSGEPPPPPPERTGSTGRVLQQPFRQSPNIAIILPNGRLQPVFGQFSRNEAGDVDIGGLAPGTYQVTFPSTSPEAPARVSTIRISGGGSTVELGTPDPTTPVAVAVDGGTNASPSQIVLTSSSTGQTYSGSERPRPLQRTQRQPGPPPASSRGRTSPLRGAGANPPSRTRSQPQNNGPARGRPAADAEEPRLSVPAGTYEVGIPSESSVFITGMTAQGASVSGRKITIGDAPLNLTVHLGSGMAGVDGKVTLDGKPAAGAMVLLVPATLGQTSSMTIVRRDQSNTDGSFQLENVTPGQYILLAIDHGWSVRWTDPDTLRPYLIRGTPLDLRSAAIAHAPLNALPR